MTATTLIRTKIITPRISSPLVQRPLLIQRLNTNLDRKLTLVSAPAGFGKTTLVIDWLQGCQRPYAWLSLDNNDNDLSLFLSYFIGAIRSTFSNACANSYQLLQESEFSQSGQIISTLTNDLLDLPQPLFLVLDDYHLIIDHTIHQWLNELLQSLPHTLHLIICSRTDPFLPLPRLRAEGQLVEIRTNELRFDDQQTREFLVLNGRNTIDETASTQINQRIEGWPAGLRMAVLSMGDASEQIKWLAKFQVQSDQFFTEYLFSEVLAHQSVEVQHFLLYSSILDRFCVDVYLALQASSTLSPQRWLETQATLENIKSANLFVIPLDEQNGWYRYHHLFQDMLRQKLMTQVGSDAIELLHHRAGAWFAKNGFTEEALQHTLAANDMETAVAIVEANSRNMVNGLERHILERWLDSLPDEIIWQRPKLLTAKAWLLYRDWNLQGMERVLARLSTILNSVEVDSPEIRFLKGQMFTLQSVVEFHIHLHFAKAISNTNAALLNLPVSESGALAVGHIHQALARIGQAETETSLRDLELLLNDPAPTAPAKLQILLGLKTIHYFTGDLIQLKQVINKSMVLANKNPIALPPAHYYNGLLNFELNNLDKAATSLKVMFEYRLRSNFLGGFASGLALTRLNQIQGAFEKAQHYLDLLRTDALRLSNAAFTDIIGAFQAFHMWLSGDSAAAYRWAKSYQPHIEQDPLMFFDPPGHLWARIILATGTKDEKTAVVAYLQANLDKLQPTEFNRRKLQLFAQLAAAQLTLSEEAAALESLSHAILLAQVGGHMRSFLDVGDVLVPLLQRLDPQAFFPDYLPQLLQAFGHQPSARSMEEATLLTTRETEILQMIAAGKSNQEIADNLFISIHTSKRHASNIYSKLNVNGRRQAIFKAQELGILSKERG